MQTIFEAELATFRTYAGSHPDQLGKYVLVRGSQVRGPFDTYEAALAAGYHHFGPELFMVKLIASPDQVHFVSRLADTCQ
jgi:hypothetical protein